MFSSPVLVILGKVRQRFFLNGGLPPAFASDGAHNHFILLFIRVEQNKYMHKSKTTFLATTVTHEHT
jgi:hypothetical protein